MPDDALTVGAATEKDRAGWEALWRAFCTHFDTDLSPAVNDGLWQRITDPAQPINCLLAFDAQGQPVGLTHYVLHLHTWSLRTICYLEDLYVAPVARGSGAAPRMIAALKQMGERQGWRRIYWHTHEDNYRARSLYDRIARRTDYVRYDIDL